MNLIRILNKFRRELYKPLSKICLIKKARVYYKGLNLKVPVISGIGSGYLVPGDNWMSGCLSVFLQNKDGIVVDIGANIGLYLVNLRALDKNRSYLGFEPNLFCNYYTQELIKMNGFQNTRIMPFALSESRGMKAFFIARTGDKTGSLYDFSYVNTGVRHSIDVLTMTGDEFFELSEPDKICSLKIDVEGAELEVLRGLKSTIKKYRPYIFCEIWHLPPTTHPVYEEKHSRLIDICALMKEIDYVILAVDIEDPVFIEEVTSVEKFNNKQRRDYILVHIAESEKLRLELAEIK